MLYQISCFFLIVTTLLCLVGLVSTTYRENLLQCAGMVLVMIGCASRVPALWLREYVEPDSFMVHAGVGLFAIGVFVRVLLRQRAEETPRPFGHYFEPDLSANWELWHSGQLSTPPRDRRTH